MTAPASYDGGRGTAATSPSGDGPARPGARVLRIVVLAAVFVCAACGLVYELSLVTLGSYLLGNTITQTSLVLAVTMFAMGVGAVAAKPLLGRPLRAFVTVELALAVVGGFAVPVLYGAFSWLSIYTPAMLVVTFAIGLLVGAEIPLLMALLQHLRRQDAARAVADINAVDYVGALVGGLAFPFLLLPLFGLLEGSLVVAAVNVVAAAVVAVALGRRARTRGPLLAAVAACVVVALALGLMAWRASAFEATAQQALYRDPIVHSERSDYQSIVVTRGWVAGAEYDDVRLYLDGDLQFSSVDEYRYHEMLVHPALDGPRGRVLVLGGGDGLALREVLAYDDVEEVTLVDLDPAVVDLARTYEPITRLNEGAWEDPRVSYVSADAFGWARDRADQLAEGDGPEGDAPYDAIVVDYPDPDSPALAKLYSVEHYRTLAGLLADDGRMVVQSGSPFFAPDAFWCVRRTLAEAGFSTTPYHADVPSFGDWGFVIATPAGTPAATPGLGAGAPDDLRYASPEMLAAATVFPPDRQDRAGDVSTLLDPAILRYSQQEWVGY
ncbi:polyamine aminopropyltransferase [Nocardioides alkalitolerans]|uniref:polyamine aminopropyltransferase n=1 Tax=Nocardioides alkalitolerans TaxID=281714 RepID=UPI0003F97FCC|nr:polyamine aminopropyltransferase [Nocardioides alkalitolerans]